MNRPSISNDTAMRQAGKTIREYSEYVDDNLECTDPVAKAILVHAQALDYLATVIADGLYAIAESGQNIARRCPR